jgi:hypothetical protein
LPSKNFVQLAVIWAVAAAWSMVVVGPAVVGAAVDGGVVAAVLELELPHPVTATAPTVTNATVHRCKRFMASCSP